MTHTALYSGPTAADLACIPEALKALAQWVLWRGADRVIEQTGEVKLNKIPIDPQTLNSADTTDPLTWGTYEACLEALPVALEEWQYEAGAAYRGGGLGFVFAADDPYAGVDLDGCVDQGTGRIAAWAQTHVDTLASYTEITPSGTGLHILVAGVLPPKGRKKGAVEMYSYARFFTMTGWHLTGTPTTIEGRDEALQAFHTTIFGGVRPTQAPPPSGLVTLDDTVLLAKAKAARNGEHFAALVTGDWTGYASHSEADMSLCVRLAFWSQSSEQIDRLFRQSGLMRDKWEEMRGTQTYGARTIAEALARQTEHYRVVDASAQHPNGNTAASAPGWMAALLCNKSGTPQQTIGNFILALQHLDPWHNKGLWYDSVREQHMLGARPVSDDEATVAGLRVEQVAEIRITNLALMGRALDYVARQTTRDLLQEWVATLPEVSVSDLLTSWLRTYAHVPDTVSDAYVADVSRIIPVAMIARILDPGCQYRYVPILEGPENAGKSKLTKALAGRDVYGRSWHVALSAGMEGKEAHMMLDGALIAELEELSSYTKTDENRMKALITAETDSFIPKFANKRVDHPRRTCFIATVNPEGDGAYLKGQSGNTRFLPIRVADIDIPGFLATRTRLFAEAKAFYLAHRDTWWQLACEEDAQGEREERRQTGVYEGQPLQVWLSTRKQCTWQDVAELHLQIPKDRWNKALQMEIAKALRAHHWLPGRTGAERYWIPGG
jgi:putative DNA primase/helicase